MPHPFRFVTHARLRFAYARTRLPLPLRPHHTAFAGLRSRLYGYHYHLYRLPVRLLPFNYTAVRFAPFARSAVTAVLPLRDAPLPRLPFWFPLVHAVGWVLLLITILVRLLVRIPHLHHTRVTHAHTHTVTRLRGYVTVGYYALHCAVYGSHRTYRTFTTAVGSYTACVLTLTRLPVVACGLVLRLVGLRLPCPHTRLPHTARTGSTVCHVAVRCYGSPRTCVHTLQLPFCALHHHRITATHRSRLVAVLAGWFAVTRFATQVTGCYVTHHVCIALFYSSVRLVLPVGLPFTLPLRWVTRLPLPLRALRLRARVVTVVPVHLPVTAVHAHRTRHICHCRFTRARWLCSLRVYTLPHTACGSGSATPLHLVGLRLPAYSSFTHLVRYVTRIPYRGYTRLHAVAVWFVYRSHTCGCPFCRTFAVLAHTHTFHRFGSACRTVTTTWFVGSAGLPYGLRLPGSLHHL